MVRYVRQGGRLELQFRKPVNRMPVYAYSGVPEAVFSAFMASSSMGNFYTRRIKDKYRAVLIG